MSQNKIIFVNPPLNPLQRYGILSQAGAVEPPLGLTYLAAVIRQEGIKTSILDALALEISLENSLKIILSEQPNFIAITLTTMSLKTSSKLASMIKEIMPQVKIIVGGPHFTSLPEETLLENPWFDVGIIGEGEKTLKELLNAFIENGSLHTIKGLAFRSGGKVILTPARERIENLDELPFPAFDLLPDLKRYYHTTTQSIKYLPTTSLVTSRGCTGCCLFCDRKTFGSKVRMHSAEYIVDMMEKLQIDFGIKGIIFEDDNFMLSKERLVNLARLIKKRKIKISWSVLSRIDTVDEEKLKIAKSCGCWQILYGIESGSQKILDFYQKGITISQIKKTVYLTKKCGLCVKGFFIVGNPLESLETLRETRDLIRRLPLDDISLTYFTPYPGADIWGQISNFGECDRDWDKFSCFDPVFLPRRVNKEDIVSSQRNILKEFYSQPRIIWSYLRRLRSLSQLKAWYKSWRTLSIYSKTQAKKKHLIINADDFGLCEGINRGTFALLQSGILEGVSIMPTGYAFESAVNSIKPIPKVEVGIHLSLLETKPILPPDEIASLVDRRGNFEKNFFYFLIRYLSGRINKKDILREFRAQIDKVKETGLKITHLDSHQHIHMLPGVFKIVLELAKEYKIAFIRLPSIPLDRRYFLSKAKFSRKLCQLVLNLVSVMYRYTLKKSGVKFYHYSFGFLESGHLTEGDIKNIIVSLKEGQYELICHPAEEDDNLKDLIGYWGYCWRQELGSLSSSKIKECASNNSLELSGFKG